MKDASKSTWVEERLCGCLTKRKTDQDMTLPPIAIRLGLFCFALTQNALLGGILFGWPSIDHTLLLAPIEEGGAGLSIDDTARIFSWASALSMFSPFLLGVVLDSFGPRAGAVVACCTVSAGSLLFASTANFWGFASAALLTSLGSPGVASCIIHISNLFPGNENLAMATLSGSVAISFSVFAVFDDLWSRWDMTLPELFQLYAGVAFSFAIWSLILYPDEPYERHVPGEEEQSQEEEEEELIPKEATDSPRSLPPIHEGGAGTFRRSTSTTPCNERHHHIESIMSTSSLHIEQPLDSYLRDERMMLRIRSGSFFAAKKALELNNKELVAAVGLKDQPFLAQVLSPAYLRATVVFIITSFMTNFYVVSISTELADARTYSAEIQHELARSFTVIMATGAFVSIPIGWLIDRIGVEFCAAITLIMGQLQMMFLLVGQKNATLFTTSFWMYTLFRQFLYPVYISSLTSRLGFKYFGVLLGIGFGMGGIAQLFLYPLDALVQGGCSLQDEDGIAPESEECTDGGWMQLHVIQALILLALLVIPLLDYREKRHREKRIEDILSSQRQPTMYGTDSA